MPLQKVTNSSIAGAVTILFVYLLHYGGIDVPDYVAGAITGIIMALVAWATPLLDAEMALWIARVQAEQATLHPPAPAEPPAVAVAVVQTPAEGESHDAA